MRISVSSGIDERITAGNISAFLDLYDILADSGLPVAIDERLRSIAFGTGTEWVRRDDDRLPPDSGYLLTTETVVVSEPLPAGAPNSLPNLLGV